MRTHISSTQRLGGAMSCIGKWSALVSVLLAAGLAHAEQAIRAVTATTQGGGEVVRIETNEPLKQLPKGFVVQTPARIALDFAGVANAVGRTLVEVNQGNVRSANIVEAGDRTRVVLNLNQATKYETKVEGNALLVLLQPVASAASVTAGAMSVQKANFSDGGSTEILPLVDIDFRRGAENSGRIIVNLPSNQTGVDIRPQGKSLVVEFLKTSLPESLRRRLDVRDFGTPVQLITTTQSGERVRMVIEPTGQWEHSAYQSDNQLVVEVREIKIDPTKLTQGPGYSGEKLSLNFQSIEVRSLLQVIADFTNFNIVTSDSVTGNVTLRLKDVPWDQALDIILQAKGLGMRKNNNVIWIAPKDELAAREKADFEAAAQVQTLEPLRTQMFRMNYAKATEVAKQLMGGGTGAGAAQGATSGVMRVLSPRGSAMAEPRTNQLFVTDVSSKLEQVTDLIKKLDIPVRQVMIEARIVEADEKFGKSLGVKFGYGAKQIGVGSYNGDKVRGSIGGSSSDYGTNSLTNMVNLPAAALNTVNPASFALALFSPNASRLLSLEISALQSDNQGRVISNPRLITADQVKAYIEQGVEIPYQESTSSGAASIAFKKAVLKLDVTPQITPEGGIILEVEVNKDSIGEVLATGVAINTNRIKTQVLVDNGGTVVIGGIFRSEEQNDEYKVPVLGDIPVMGHLFKNRSKTLEKKELLVFLTPRVLGDGVNLN